MADQEKPKNEDITDLDTIPNPFEGKTEEELKQMEDEALDELVKAAAELDVDPRIADIQLRSLELDYQRTQEADKKKEKQQEEEYEHNPEEFKEAAEGFFDDREDVKNGKSNEEHGADGGEGDWTWHQAGEDDKTDDGQGQGDAKWSEDFQEGFDYAPLDDDVNQKEEDEEEEDEENKEDQDGDKEDPTVDNRSFVPLTNNQVGKIKSNMSKLNIKAPLWAQRMPEDVWMKKYWDAAKKLEQERKLKESQAEGKTPKSEAKQQRGGN